MWNQQSALLIAVGLLAVARGDEDCTVTCPDSVKVIAEHGFTPHRA